MRKQLVLLYFFSSCCLVFTEAQMLDMKFHDPFSDLTLTGNYATRIIQDSTGIIWVATRDGLNAFNGSEIKNYVHDPQDTSSLINNTVLDLFEDSKGRLWIATNNGLCMYNPFMDNFIALVSDRNYNGLSDPYVTNVTEDHNANVFVGSVNGVYRFNEEEKKFAPFVFLEKGEITEILVDNKNNLWISAVQGGGIHYFDRKLNELIPIQKFGGAENLFIREVCDISFYEEKLWIATYGEGICSFDIKNGLLKKYPTSSEYEKFSTFTYVDNDNRLWTCDLTGLKLFDTHLDMFYGYYSDKTPGNTIKKNAIGIYQDRQGNYWTFHHPGGVGLRIVPRGIDLTNTNQEFYWHTSENNITSFATDANGNWWIGNHSNGIDIFHWKNGRMKTYFNEPDSKSLGRGTIFAIFSDSNGKMWVGSNMGGLQYFDAQDSTFNSFVHNPEDESSIGNNDVRSIAEDIDGNFWIVVHGEGVDKFDRRLNKFTHYNKENSNLSNNWAYKVFIDSKENLWVGTSWGLNKLPKGEGQFQVYLNNTANPSSLVDNEINDIFEDSKGQIWIATAKGICRFNENSDNFTRYTPELKSNFICAIQEDTKGNLWLSTYNGIEMFNPETGFLMTFDEIDGVQGAEFNRGVSFKDYENMMFFGGVNGLNHFIPEDLHFNNTPPKVIISKLKLFNKEVRPEDQTGILSGHISNTDRIVLDYSHNVISLQYSALNMISLEKNTFKYRLEGFDNEWTEAGTKKEAVYTNLNPGNYIFSVIASNNDQIWNDEGVSLSIIILPPWWQTWWFKVLAFITILLLILLVFYLRTSQLRRQKLVLEQMVEDRTQKLNEKNQLLSQQANDLNEVNALLEERTQMIEEQSSTLKQQTIVLTQKNNELERLNKTKDKLFSIVAHDLRNPFHAILSLSDMFYAKFGKLSDDDKIKMAGYINSSGKLVYNLLENLLKWARSQSNQIIFNPENLDIYTLIDENILLLSKNAQDKDIAISISKKDNLMVRGDKDMLNTIIRNLLNNAIKFTDKNGKINIAVNENDRYAEVAIKDNGIGMDERVLSNIFSLDENGSRDGTAGEKGSAIGLMLCKDFVERNNGQISVESQEKIGSTFKFTIPLSM